MVNKVSITIHKDELDKRGDIPDKRLYFIMSKLSTTHLDDYTFGLLCLHSLTLAYDFENKAMLITSSVAGRSFISMATESYADILKSSILMHNKGFKSVNFYRDGISYGFNVILKEEDELEDVIPDNKEVSIIILNNAIKRCRESISNKIPNNDITTMFGFICRNSLKENSEGVLMVEMVKHSLTCNISSNMMFAKVARDILKAYKDVFS